MQRPVVMAFQGLKCKFSARMHYVLYTEVVPTGVNSGPSFRNRPMFSPLEVLTQTSVPSWIAILLISYAAKFQSEGFFPRHGITAQCQTTEVTCPAIFSTVNHVLIL